MLKWRCAHGDNKKHNGWRSLQPFCLETCWSQVKEPSLLESPTLLTTIDISKAFDAIPRHRLMDKLYNTNMHNNTKRWLANYLGGTQSRVSFNVKSSHTRNFPNRVLQGLFCPLKIYMHDTPQLKIKAVATVDCGSIMCCDIGAIRQMHG